LQQFTTTNATLSILYALPKLGYVNTRNTNCTIVAPSRTASRIGSTLADIGGDSNVRTIYLVFAMYYTNTILLITAIVFVAINS
jgi:hypothetical protein